MSVVVNVRCGKCWGWWTWHFWGGECRGWWTSYTHFHPYIWIFEEQDYFPPDNQRSVLPVSFGIVVGSQIIPGLIITQSQYQIFRLSCVSLYGYFCPNEQFGSVIFALNSKYWFCFLLNWKLTHVKTWMFWRSVSSQIWYFHLSWLQWSKHDTHNFLVCCDNAKCSFSQYFNASMIKTWHS